MTKPILEVNRLKKYYFDNDTLLDKILMNEKSVVKAADDVNFDINRGESFGLIGESGCGKSTTGRTIMRLNEPTGGEVLFEGKNIFNLDKDGLRRFRRRAQMVLQDPFSSLNPRMTTGEIVKEPLDIHEIGADKHQRRLVDESLERVGLSADQRDRYPHEFSGGQRQRIGIARALAPEPDFIILDEPVSALDVSLQAQILNLLDDVQNELDITFLFITHNLSVVDHFCDRVAVMYLGNIVEIGPTEKVFKNPSHPYTKMLMDSIPRPNVDEHEREIELPTSEVPSPRNPPKGCPFHTRCLKAREVCKDQKPEYINQESNHKAACFRGDEDHEYWDSNALPHSNIITK